MSTGKKDKDWKTDRIKLVKAGHWDENKAAQLFKRSNSHKKSILPIFAWLVLKSDETLRRCRRNEGVNRLEFLILCRCYLFNDQKRGASKTNILRGWRIDERRALKYLDHLSLLDYLRVERVKTPFFGGRVSVYYTLSPSGLRLLSEYLGLLSLVDGE